MNPLDLRVASYIHNIQRITWALSFRDIRHDDGFVFGVIVVENVDMLRLAQGLKVMCDAVRKKITVMESTVLMTLITMFGVTQIC